MCHGGDSASREDRPVALDEEAADKYCEPRLVEVEDVQIASRPDNPTLPRRSCGVQGAPQVGSLSDWMSELLEDGQCLADVSLPGSHNSASWAPAAFVAASQCQARDLGAQLHMGIRFFDLRVRPSGGLCHGVVSCGLTLLQAMLCFTTFLQNHPREVIVIRVKNEAQGTRGSSKRVDELMNSLAESADHKLYLQQRLPKVGEVRGRIVLLADWVEAKFGIPWRGKLFRIQDEYRCKTGEDKWQVVERTLNATRPVEGQMSINFTSATALPSRGPLAIARVVNQRFAAYLRQRPCPGFVGTVVMDFPTVALCELIVRRNCTKHSLNLDRPVVDPVAERWLSTLRTEVRAVASRADAAMRPEGVATVEKSRQLGHLKDAVRQVARVYTRYLAEHATAELQLTVVDEPSAPLVAAAHPVATGAMQPKSRVCWSGSRLPAGSPRASGLTSARAASCGPPSKEQAPSPPPPPARRHSDQEVDAPALEHSSSSEKVQEAPNAAKTRRVVVKKFSATIKRCEDGVLGLQVERTDPQRLMVLAVEAFGPVANHNKQHKDAAIVAGDFIMAVDGISGNSEKMWCALRDGRGTAVLLVMHPVGDADKEEKVSSGENEGRGASLLKLFGPRS
mmetsp:Transcript_16198/g.37247  ORF Transcript_16198/g.37247 Transcript_16198/m.37247 type:complete len:622 (-) Transcript_16198:52-1917(-)